MEAALSFHLLQARNAVQPALARTPEAMNQRPEIWDIPNIALISATPSTFPDEILGRLKRRNWQVSLKATRIRDGFKSLYDGKTSIMLVHDTPELPASFVLRAQIADPLAIITPTIVVAHESHSQDLGLFKEFGMPEVIESATNPAAFIGGFEYLVRRWSVGNLRRLYQARRFLIEKKYLPFTKLLTSLNLEGDIQPLVTPCTAQLLLRQVDFKSVEKMLLAALKEHPRNIGIIVNLVEFYLRAAMPETALSLLAAARKNYGSPRVLGSDQIQAYLMLNQVGPCIPILEDLIKEDYCRKQAQEFLVRCLYAEGYSDRFERASASLNSSVDEFKMSWNKAAS